MREGCKVGLKASCLPASCLEFLPCCLLPSCLATEAGSLFVDVVVRLAGRDVVDVRHRFVGRVHIVETERAAGLLHRDRPARLVVAGLLFLRAAGSALRLRVGAEIATAGRRTARGSPATARIEGPRASAAAERTGRPRRESAGTWTGGEPAGPRRPARTAVLTRTRLADGERPPVEHLSVEALDRLFGVCAIGEFDEREPTRASGLAIDRQHDLRRRSDGPEVAPQIGFGGAVRKIPDEQTNGQSTIS